MALCLELGPRRTSTGRQAAERPAMSDQPPGANGIFGPPLVASALMARVENVRKLRVELSLAAKGSHGQGEGGAAGGLEGLAAEETKKR